MVHYQVDTRNEGADPYSAVMLFKCLLLQKWFRIPSDPELESQINDRISLKEFLQLPLHIPSPDHSTFSSFRNRLSQKAMIKINNEILQRFAAKGLSSVDINNGFILATTMTKASCHDSPLPSCTLHSLHTEQTLKKLHVDKGYYGRPNRDFLCLNHIQDGIIRKEPPPQNSLNMKNSETKKISKKRYTIEQYFGLSHLHDRAKRALRLSSKTSSMLCFAKPPLISTEEEKNNLKNQNQQ